MLAMLRSVLSSRGLSLHPTKCQVQTNREYFQRGRIQVEEGFSIEVLPHGACLDLLGTKLSLQDPTGSEITHRIATGWSKFCALNKMLTRKNFSLNKRLKLFHSTVSGTVLWGAESWTPRVEELRRLRATQNAMLRRIVCCGRAEGEDWVEWAKRATRQARRLAQNVGAKEWVCEHFVKKWKWAGHLARMHASEWALLVTGWRDSSWQAAVRDRWLRPARPSRRPWMKFEHILRRFCNHGGHGEWRDKSQERDAWRELETVFASWASAQ